MHTRGRHIALLILTAASLAGCGNEADTLASSGNLPPTISGTPPTTIQAGANYSFTPSATDPNGDALTFTASGLPTWASINATTGTISGTPSEANVGMSNMISIEVSDSQANAQLAGFRIQVASAATNANPPPTITGTPASSATVGQVYAFMPVGDDPNDQPLTYSIQNRPAWATFTAATGELRGTPISSNIGTYNNIIISVSDGETTVALPGFNLAVAAAPTTPPANRAPTISGTPPATGTVGVAYSFRPVGRDADGNPLQWSIMNRPSWATFSQTTGRLSGTPTANDIGTSARITITVSDGSLSASLPSFTIQIGAVANRPPTITGSPLTSLLALAGYTFQPSASDPDGNPLTFSITNRPAWATFNTANGSLTGTPALTDIGTSSSIVITVSDGQASASLPAFSIAVLATATGNAVVRWTIPTTNTDGSPLSDLTGFRVVYGRTSTTLDQTANVNNPSLSVFTVENLVSGQWYFAVYAVNSRGVTSEISNLATKFIQ
jgi:hypothetical protein